MNFIRKCLCAFFLLPCIITNSDAQSNPVVLVPGVMIEQVITVPEYCSRIAVDPITENLFYLQLSGEVHEVFIDQLVPTDTLLYTTSDHSILFLQGLTFWDSTLYLVGDIPFDTTQTRGIVIRGKLQPDGSREWDTVAITDLYPSGNTAFDHGFSGITINAAGDSLYINSGSRTDHGEVQDNGGLYPLTREVPLTSAIFRIPAHAKNLVLPNDSAALVPYLFAEGVRNSFDLAFDATGKLFAAENSGERDDPEELNWVQQGKHYGFPWIMGGNYNPQQFPGYDPEADLFLNHNRKGYLEGHFHNDPDFPPLPPGLEIMPGILNLGPDADYFRDSLTGLVFNASEIGYPLRSFTTHRAPLGLIFDNDSAIGFPYTGNAFMLSYQKQGDSSGIALDSSNGTLLDPSEDLIHLQLHPDGTNFQMNATRIVGDFEHPVDACIAGNVIYVLEYSLKEDKGGIWKLSFPIFNTSITASNTLTLKVSPNPFSDNLYLDIELRESTRIDLKLLDLLGNEAFHRGESLYHAGRNQLSISTERLLNGLYLLQLRTEDGIMVSKIVVK